MLVPLIANNARAVTIDRLLGRDLSGRRLLGQGDDPVELAPLLGYDQRLG